MCGGTEQKSNQNENITGGGGSKTTVRNVLAVQFVPLTERFYFCNTCSNPYTETSHYKQPHFDSDCAHLAQILSFPFFFFFFLENVFHTM